MSPQVDPYEAALAGLQGRKKSLEEQMNMSLEKAAQPAKLGPGQAMAQAVLGLLPMVLGYAMAKKRGGAIGAQAGQQAASLYDVNAKETAKAEQEVAKVQAAKLLGQLGDVNRQESAMGLEQIKSGSRRELADEKFKRDKELLGDRFENDKALKGIPQAKDTSARTYNEIESDLISKLEKGWTPEEGKVAATLPRVMAEKQRYERTKEYGKTREAAFEREQSKFNIPGYKRTMRDGKPEPILKEDYQKAQTWATTAPLVNRQIDLVLDAMNRKDAGAFFQAKKVLVEQMKNLKGYGAAFSEKEIQIIEDQLGSIADLYEANKFLRDATRGAKAVNLFGQFRQNLIKDYTFNMITHKTIPEDWTQSGDRYFRKTPDGKGLVEIPYKSLLAELSSFMGK